MRSCVTGPARTWQDASCKCRKRVIQRRSGWLGRKLHPRHCCLKRGCLWRTQLADPARNADAPGELAGHRLRQADTHAAPDSRSRRPRCWVSGSSLGQLGWHLLRRAPSLTGASAKAAPTSDAGSAPAARDRGPGRVQHRPKAGDARAGRACAKSLTEFEFSGTRGRRAEFVAVHIYPCNSQLGALGDDGGSPAGTGAALSVGRGRS